jgi:adenylate kinase
MRAIILLGAPGAGKGTAAGEIQQKTDFVQVSTGDMLREAVKAGREVGKKAESYMKAGELVPDEVIIGIVKERLSGDGKDSRYMFDGFPRTVNQAALLDDVLAEAGTALEKVFFLEVTAEVVVERLSGRRICSSCGAVYHVRNMPPKREGVCDVCGGSLYQRPDDTEKTIKNRLAVFERQTHSLIEYYENKNILCRVDASESAEKTVKEILTVLD